MNRKIMFFIVQKRELLPLHNCTVRVKIGGWNQTRTVDARFDFPNVQTKDKGNGVDFTSD